MFREPRRKDRTISLDDGIQILLDNTWGILGTIGPDGWPYSVPLSYVYSKKNNAIFFHCASSGHKIENIDLMNVAKVLLPHPFSSLMLLNPSEKLNSKLFNLPKFSI